MHRTTRLMLAAACATALTACGTAEPSAAPVIEVPETTPSPSSSSSPSSSPTATKPKTDPNLVDADLSQLKNYAIDFRVPVVITTSSDAGAQYHLDAQPDGSVDFSGTAPTDTTRMTLRPAKVRKRTEKTRNHVMIVATPVAKAAGPKSCVTDERKGVLKMEPCEPGAANQSWRLTPAGDSGLFELSGAHTAVRVNEGRIVEEGGWSALETTAVKP